MRLSSFGSQLSMKSTIFEIAHLNIIIIIIIKQLVKQHMSVKNKLMNRSYSSTIMFCRLHSVSLHCLQHASAADTASDCCEMWRIIFKTEADQ